jgi:hypothetical protein
MKNWDKSLEYIPWMLINCPSFSAAPLICESFETRRLMLASVIIIDDWLEEPEPVLRRTSVAAPYPNDAASPKEDYEKVEPQVGKRRTSVMK